MQYPAWLKYPYAEIGTPVVIVVALLIYAVAKAVIQRREPDYREAYRKRQGLLTLVVVLAVAAITVLWARILQRTGTFLGLAGAGLAIALKEWSDGIGENFSQTYADENGLFSSFESKDAHVEVGERVVAADAGGAFQCFPVATAPAGLHSAVGRNARRDSHLPDFTF